MISREQLAELAGIRARRPEAIAEAARGRKRRAEFDSGRGLFLLTADHPGRGVLQVGADPVAIGNRAAFLGRLLQALEHPAVDGITATPDVVEDLLLLGALEDKVVLGSMNRSGLSGSTWELDDRFSAYGPASISTSNLDGGKMLLRIDLKDPGSNETIEACAAAVSSLARSKVRSVIEPLPAVNEGGRIHISNDPEAMIRAISVASGLGDTSAYTWLAIPATGDVERVTGATTLPVMILGGDPGLDPAVIEERWRRALAQPQVRGLIGGRTLLYPEDGNVERAIAHAASIIGRT